jgi:hypothetical protein
VDQFFSRLRRSCRGEEAEAEGVRRNSAQAPLAQPPLPPMPMPMPMPPLPPMPMPLQLRAYLQPPLPPDPHPSAGFGLCSLRHPAGKRTLLPSILHVSSRARVPPRSLGESLWTRVSCLSVKEKLTRGQSKGF